MRVRKGIGKCLEEENERTKDVNSIKISEIRRNNFWKSMEDLLKVTLGPLNLLHNRKQKENVSFYITLFL